jgi:D-alanyl-D-alanine carboxypeptidase
VPRIVALTACLFAALTPAAFARSANERSLQTQLDGLVTAKGGPPGAIVTLRRGTKSTVFTAGVANRATRAKPRATDHMRIASIAKAFSGAVAFSLIEDGKLKLTDTIGSVLPDLPAAWAAVTVRQLLNHTSGVPDYTKSDGFLQQFQDDPKGFVSPAKIISWVAADRLVFPPGSKYEYSNTDNIVIGLMAEKVRSKPYGTQLSDVVFKPLRLLRTSFPTRVALPRPFIHGYTIDGKGKAQDVSTLLSPSGAWASGAVVSTPNDLNAFIRGLLAGRLFAKSLQAQQLRFVRGSSSPPGPGTNFAGLAIFRYQTRCGTVYGHTGNFPGYVQFAAASRDGKRAITTSLSIPAPTGRLLASLRAMQETGVCALLRG